MIEYTSGANKTRVWWGELPDWNYKTGDIIRLELDIQGLSSNRVSETCYGAIEMFILRGSRVLYGGLGATLSPQREGSLMAEIAMSQDQGQLWSDPLSGRADTAYKGLPYYEYVIGICNGILYSKSKYRLGARTLRVAWATHGLAGSSPWVFHVLSDSLIGLLVRERKEEITFEELKELMGQAELRARRFYGNWPIDSFKNGQ
jgi:hypothetical protein